jgi:hypothetical protein
MGASAVNVEGTQGFAHTWKARALKAPPLIAPARQFVYPQYVPGEEDALSRGALLLEVRPASGGIFLATCALGFRDPSLPSGVWACPAADDLLAVAGGYAYVVNTLQPETCVHLPLRPVTQIASAVGDGLILLAGFHEVIAVDAKGLRWKTGRLSWEGVTLGDVRTGKLHGTGWNMREDRDVPFVVDLVTGVHEGGGFG